MNGFRLLLTVAVASAAVASGSHGLTAQTASKTYTLDQAPEDLKPVADRGLAAMKVLQASLQTRLVELMPTSGPAGALDVCRKEAYTIAADLGMQQGMSLGRTSHKLRNPQNAPKPWAAPIVADNANKKAAAVQAYVADLGDKVGVLQPIGMGEACSLCHGAPSWMPTDVAATLKQHYPDDKATGFATGDLRGWIWAEVPKQ